MHHRTLLLISLLSSIFYSIDVYAWGCTPKCPKGYANVRGSCICPKPVESAALQENILACSSLSIAQFILFNETLREIGLNKKSPLSEIQKAVSQNVNSKSWEELLSGYMYYTDDKETVPLTAKLLEKLENAKE